MSTFPPGATIGILGGGQLGRMMILAGRPHGYRFRVYEPAADCTAGRIADQHFQAAYEDGASLDAFAESVDVITLEFENIPLEAISTLEKHCPVRPGRRALEVCQHRLREKRFLAEGGFPHVPFQEVASPEALVTAVDALGGPVVVKTAAFGYDGKGQIRLEALQPGDADGIWDDLGRPDRVVVEKWIDFSCEVSVVCARSVSGVVCPFPVAENIHRNHILHQSMVPASIPTPLATSAEAIAARLAKALEVIGLLAVEFFVTPEGQLLVNEMAPRPHNSGHYTMNGCPVSQFEQHLRMVVGLEAAPAELHSPVIMTNLLGDLWEGGDPDWVPLLSTAGAHLHLYDKGMARPGRKMGHYNLRAATLEDARSRADLRFKEMLRG